MENHSLENPSIVWLSELAQKKNLMEIDVDAEYYGGDLRSIANAARRILADLSGEQVRLILMFADRLVSDMVENEIELCDQDGQVRTLTRELLSCLDAIDLLAPFASWLAGDPVDLVVDDGDQQIEVEITTARLFAAYALSEACGAIEFGRWPEWLMSGGARCAIAAAKAVTLAKAASEPSHPINLLAAKRGRVEQAKLAAKAAIENDARGKGAAKRQAREIWEAWEAGDLRSKFRNQAALARHIVDVTALESPAHVEELIRRWRRGGGPQRAS